MKRRIHIRQLLAIVLFAAAGSLSLPAAPSTAQPAATKSIKTEMPKSVFILPKNPNEGRDPFFPDSMRLFEHTKQKNATVSLNDLVVKGILASGDRVFAIVNNHTFAPDEDGTVLANGHKLNVHCVAIDPQRKTVTVEANGTIAILHFIEKP